MLILYLPLHRQTCTCICKYEQIWTHTHTYCPFTHVCMLMFTLRCNSCSYFSVYKTALTVSFWCRFDYQVRVICLVFGNHSTFLVFRNHCTAWCSVITVLLGVTSSVYCLVLSNHRLSWTLTPLHRRLSDVMSARIWTKFNLLALNRVQNEHLRNWIGEFSHSSFTFTLDIVGI